MAIEIQLSRGKVAVIDDEDANLAAFKWCVLSATKTYVVRTVNKRRVLLHRSILSQMLGRELLPDEMVDHIDGNPLNNRRCNLRLASRQQNSFNSHLRNDSATGLKGVTWHEKSQKWRARIMANGKHRSLGLFATAELAHAAYVAAAKEYFGEFANTGEINE